MAYAIDDQVAQDERFRSLRKRTNFADAWAMYTLIGIRSAADRSDGRLFVEDALAQLPGSQARAQKALAALVETGLLVRIDSSEIEVVGFLEFNESRERMLERRSKTAERVKRHYQRSKADAVTTLEANDEPNALGNAPPTHGLTDPPVPSSQRSPSGRRRSATSPPKSVEPAVIELNRVIAAVSEGFKSSAGTNPKRPSLNRAQIRKLSDGAARERPDNPLEALRDLGAELGRKNLDEPWLYLAKHGFDAMPVGRAPSQSTAPPAPQDPELDRLRQAVRSIDPDAAPDPATRRRLQRERDDLQTKVYEREDQLRRHVA